MDNIAYLRLQITRPERLEMLRRFVERLREVKQSQAFLPDEEWAEYFDETALAYFSELTPEEMKEWEQDWKSAPVEHRLTDPSLSPHWDFGSFLDALKNGEFFITELRVSGEEARLVFEPLAYPFGGSACLVAIAEAFGQQVVGVEDGSGYSPDKRLPSWKPRAQRGKGKDAL